MLLYGCSAKTAVDNYVMLYKNKELRIKNE